MLKEFVVVSLAVALGVILIMIMIAGYDIFQKLSVRDSAIAEYEYVDEVDYDKNQVNGGDVIGWIRYFFSDDSVVVTVSNNNGIEEFDAKGYNSSDFQIDPFDTYNITYIKDGSGKLVQINCTK